MSVDLVVSAYQDSLDWVGPICQPDVRVHVYDKWDGPGASSGEAAYMASALSGGDCKWVYACRRNVGLCDHSYLHHIVENYDSLADWTVFTPDGPHDHLPEGVEMEDVMVPGDSLRVPRLWRGRDWNPITGRLNWEHWGSNPKRGGTSWKDWYESGKVTPAALSFVEWARKYVGVDVNGESWPGYAPGGIYGVPKRAITYLPKAFYARLREQLSHAREPEESHFAERSFCLIFSGRARYVTEGQKD